MVPDQGGWSGIIKIAEYLRLEIIYLPTDEGLINPNLLDDILIKRNP